MNRTRAGCSLVLVAMLTASAVAADKSFPSDNLLTAAKQYVEKSDKYLHHSHLKRGMKGYGQTVLAGVDQVRFEAEIVSVMAGSGPHQDMILARLTGQNLEKTGIIAGMSGSPVYVKDPRDGKMKMIGAVAFGWFAQNEPICGIQPITQMLAIAGVLDDVGAKNKPAPRAGNRPGRGGRQGGTSLSAAETKKWLAAMLDPKKANFAEIAWRQRSARSGWESDDSRVRLKPLSCPLMVGGLRGEEFRKLEKLLRPSGLVPVQAGNVGKADAAAAGKVRLESGAALAVPLVMGDVDFTAMGTVTDVIGKRVLGFGHAFYAEGNVSYPMGTGYIHTVISGVLESFKMGSTLKVTGRLDLDEETGISGKVGDKAEMIPMTVRVSFPYNQRKQTFHYQICRERYFTPLFSWLLAAYSVRSYHGLPVQHTVEHAVTVDYGRFGKYTAKNVSSDWGIGPLVSDLSRPVAAMIGNPYAADRYPKSITVDVVVRKGVTEAQLLKVDLVRDTYKPGETIRGKVLIRRFRQPRAEVPFTFRLPADIEEGDYQLILCDADTNMRLKVAENPQMTFVRDEKQLFAALQNIVSAPADRLYLRMRLKDTGLAVRQTALPSLPGSRAVILAEAKPTETATLRRSIVQTQAGKYIFSGRLVASVKIRKDIPETTIGR